MENRNFKTIMILMVIIIIMLFNIMQENKQIRNQVNILNNHGNSSQQNLRNDIMYLRNEINDLQEELLKKDAFILDEKFDFISYKDNVSVIEFTGEFNNIGKNSSLYFQYHNLSTDTWEKIMLENESGLVYKCRVELNMDNEYEYNVLNEGDVSNATESKEIDNGFYTYQKYNISVKGNEKDLTAYDVDIRTKTLVEALRIKSMSIKLYSNESIIDTVSFIDEADYYNSKRKNKHEAVMEVKRVETAENYKSFYGGIAEVDFDKYDQKIDKVELIVEYNDGKVITEVL
jgi:hypothetical protein